METALRLPLHAPVVSRVRTKTPAPEGRREQPSDPSCRRVHTNAHPPNKVLIQMGSTALSAHREDSQGQSSNSIWFLTSPQEKLSLYSMTRLFVVPPTSNYILRKAFGDLNYECVWRPRQCILPLLSFPCPGL